MQGQCIDMVRDLHDTFIGDGEKYKFVYEVKRIDDTFIGDGEKYKFVYEVKRIDDKCEVIVYLKKTKSRSRTVLKYKIHVEMRNSGDLSLLRQITREFMQHFLRSRKNCTNKYSLWTSNVKEKIV